MLDEEQTLKFSVDLKDFIFTTETLIMLEICDKNFEKGELLSKEHMERFDWIMDFDYGDPIISPGGLLCNEIDSLALRSTRHQDLRWDEEAYCRFYDIKFIQEKKLKRFFFLTLTGKNRIPDTPENIKKMLEFGKILFTNDNYTRFHKVTWNIEVGKHRDKPNLHLHACIWFENTNKNFHSLKPGGRSDVRTLWYKYFRFYGLDYGKLSYQQFSGKMVKTMYQDKLDYLENKDKSVLHKNYRDLEILEKL